MKTTTTNLRTDVLGETPDLPRGGVSLRFYVEKIDERHKDDTAWGFRVNGYRWLLIFAEGGEARAFKTIGEFKSYCWKRWGVSRWRRDREPNDWTPEDGDSWISRRGELWPGFPKAPALGSSSSAAASVARRGEEAT